SNYYRLKEYFRKHFIINHSIDEWFDSTIGVHLKKINKNNYDVVIVEYVFFSKAFEYFDNNVLKVIDTHDVFTDRDKSFIENSQRPRWFYTNAKEEAKGLNRSDMIIAIHDKDKKYFDTITQKPVITIG